MTDPVELCKSLLKGVKPQNGHFVACCPAHDDRTPSLSLTRGDDGRALLRCHAGCSQDAIITALGINAKDLFAKTSTPLKSPRRPTPPPPPPKPKTPPFDSADKAVQSFVNTLGPYSHRYEYTDGRGDLIQIVLRWDADDNRVSKEIRPVTRWPDGWRKQALPQYRPLYQLDRLKNREFGVVHIVEGEKCADMLNSISPSILATTWSGGTNAIKQTDWAPLAGHDIIIFPDNDDPGMKAAKEIAARLSELPDTNVAIAQWPDVFAGEDVADMLERYAAAGMSADNMLDKINIYDVQGDVANVENANDIIKLTRLADVEPVPVRWLWRERFAVGKLAMVSGDGGLGKSFMTLDWASRVSRGAEWPDGSPNERGGVLLISCEDDAADTVRPRLDAAGADVQNIYHVDDLDLTNIPALRAAIKQVPNCRLCVIDPVSAYLGKTDSHSNAEVRAFLKPLGLLAAEAGVAIICVNHLRKGDGSASHRTIGSVAFTNAVRASYVVCKSPDDPSGVRRLILPVKNNIGDDKTGFAYRLIQTDGPQPVVAWEPDPVTMSADEAMAVPTKRNKTDECADWLLSELADGPRHATELETAGSGRGYSKTTLGIARKRAGIESRKADFGGGWIWRLAEEPDFPIGKKTVSSAISDSSHRGLETEETARNLQPEIAPAQETKNSEETDSQTLGQTVSSVDASLPPDDRQPGETPYQHAERLRRKGELRPGERKAS